MINRQQKIEELIQGFLSLKKNTLLQDVNFSKIPKATPSQWAVLVLVSNHEKISTKEIAYILHMSSSAVTQLVNGLFESGYIERKENIEDRRIISLTLSKKAKKYVEEIKKITTKNSLKMFNILTDKEFYKFYELSNKVLINLTK